MSKKVEIKCCDTCPHMDYVYYSYNGECSLLTTKDGKYRDLTEEINIFGEIHPECPLPDWKTDED